MFNKDVLNNVLNGVQNWEVFCITEKLNNLSISDRTLPSGRSAVNERRSAVNEILSSSKGSGSSSSSKGSGSEGSSSSSVVKYGFNITDYPRRDWKNYLVHGESSSFTRMLTKTIQSAYLNIPPNLMAISDKYNDLILNLGFRILPQQMEYIKQEIYLEKNYREKLHSLKNSLGLTLSRDNLTKSAIMKYKTTLSKAEILYSRFLIEVITYNSGLYGRYFILVHLGVGCTVWYGLAPGPEYCLPVSNTIFHDNIDFSNFIHSPEEHVQPGFVKISFKENEENILPILAENYKNVKPFKDINIPQGGSLLMACTLAISIAILFSLGVAPSQDLENLIQM